MKSAAQSMTPQQAAQAFYGMDDDRFSEIVEKLASTDPRLLKVFDNMRKRYQRDAN